MGKLSFVQTAARKGMHDVRKIHGSNFSTMRRKYPGIVRILIEEREEGKLKLKLLNPRE